MSSLLLFQQGWNITVDLVIGPKGIRQMTSQDAKVERDWEHIPSSPRLCCLPCLLPPTLACSIHSSCPIAESRGSWYKQWEGSVWHGADGSFSP